MSRSTWRPEHRYIHLDKVPMRLSEKGRVGFYKEMPARERPEVYATPDRKSGMLVLELEGSKEWARGMGIGKEGVRRFLEVLGCVLGGDLGPHVR